MVISTVSWVAVGECVTDTSVVMEMRLIERVALCSEVSEGDDESSSELVNEAESD